MRKGIISYLFMPTVVIILLYAGNEIIQHQGRLLIRELYPFTLNPVNMEKIAVKLIMASSAIVLCFSVYKLVIDLV